MNPDRATLNYLNSFSEEIRHEGQRLHDEGAVTQIFGNHLYIQGRVDDQSWTCRTTLRLQGNDWNGESTCPPVEGGDAALYATMLERMERGTELPEVPKLIHRRIVLSFRLNGDSSSELVSKRLVCAPRNPTTA